MFLVARSLTHLRLRSLRCAIIFMWCNLAILTLSSQFVNAPMTAFFVIAAMVLFIMSTPRNMFFCLMTAWEL